MKNHKASVGVTVFFAVLCSLLVSSSLAFNITEILSQYPRFSTLNDLLSRTKLSGEINGRKSITVLAVDNAAIASFLAGKPYPKMDDELVKEILRVHVILDYYDVEKLTKLGISGETSTLTTLFQASGLAGDNRGFVNVSLVGEGEIAFGSAARGGEMGSKLVETVAAHPYNISVLEITAPIFVPGLDSGGPVKSPSPALAPEKSPESAPAPAPAPTRKSKASPAASPAESPVPESGAPASSPVSSDEGLEEDSQPPMLKPSGGSRTGTAVGVGVAAAVLAVSFLMAN